MNLKRIVTVSIAMMLMQIVIHAFNWTRYTQDALAFAGYYRVLSILVMLVSAAFLISMYAAHRSNKLFGKAHVFFWGYVYSFFVLQLSFLTLDILNDQAIYAYFLAITVIGFAVVLPPPISVTSILLATAYTVAMLVVTHHTYASPDYVLQIGTIAELFILTLLTTVVSVSLYNMTARDFLATIKLEEANERLNQFANTDQLTGVRNRNAYSRENAGLLRSFSEMQRGVALAMVDVDFFKSYNDAFGHQAGDQCLHMVAQSLRKSFGRKDDIVYRYGGEEFLVIFAADRAQAFELADRARRNVEAEQLPHANQSVSPYVTVSVGVCFAENPMVVDNLDAIVHLADEALYASKSSGRNKTTLYTNPTP